MNMKNYKISAVALVALFASCTTDFLTVSNPIDPETETFYKNEAELKQALVAAYAPMQWDPYWEGWGSTIQVADYLGDDVLSGSIPTDNPYLHRYDDYAVIVTGDTQKWWNMSFRGVYRANLVLENLQNAIDAGMDQAMADRFRAEAVYLRAYHYLNLWRMYGNIPYYKTNLTYPFVTPQMTPDEIYQDVVWGEGGLDSVIDLLPDKNSNANGGANARPAEELGRATKAAAQMLKARWVMYQMDESKFQDVLDDMKEIINGGKFALKTTRTGDYSVAKDAETPAMSYQPNVFETLWMDEGEFSSETIFDINYTDEGSKNNWSGGGHAGGTVGVYMQSPRDLGTNDDFAAGGYGFSNVAQELYDLYDDADMRKDGGIINMEKWYENYLASGRAAVSSSNTGVDYFYNKDHSAKNTGLYLKKIIARRGYNQRGSGTGETVMAFRNNIRVFRFAETLLNAAELSVRLSTGEAQEWLDMVRDRAYDVENGGTAPELTATLDNIMLERRKEFVGEGLRYWDLVRTGQAQAVLGPQGWSSNINWNGISRWVAPIPEGEVSSSASTPYPLVQNPGY
jgi:hypothetical protein